MSLRAKSHTDLQTAGRSSLDDRLSFSMSSGNFNRGSRFGNGTGEEVKGHSRSIRRPVRAVRPVSAVSSTGSFLQINHLQGEFNESFPRTLLRVSAPLTGRDHGPGHFDELPAFGGAERPDSDPHPRRSRKVVDYFWIPTDQE